ncbi:MAG: hypothetical protein U0792_13390 [Gemmataceae bacterium]
MPRPDRKRPAIRPNFDELESRTLPSNTSLWVIQGDQNPADLNDTIVIERSPTVPGVVQAVVNGEVVSTHLRRTLSEIRIWGGAGDDSISVNIDNAANRFLVRVLGGDGNDILRGTNGNDYLFAGAGDDVVDGGGGHDWLRGGSGNDTSAAAWAAINSMAASAATPSSAATIPTPSFNPATPLLSCRRTPTLSVRFRPSVNSTTGS